MIHLTERALRTLYGGPVDGPLVSLCGQTHWTTVQTYPVIVTERAMLESLTSATRNPERWRTPYWLDPIRTPAAFCPVCQAAAPEINHRFLVAMDRVLEMGPHYAKPSSVRGERPIDLLVAWLRRVGPQRKTELEGFLWARAHPHMPDDVEDYSGERGLHMTRQSKAFWSTNWPRILENGTLVRTTQGLYAAP